MIPKIDKVTDRFVIGFGQPAQVARVIGTWSDDGNSQPLVNLYVPATGRFERCHRVRVVEDWSPAYGVVGAKRTTHLKYVGPGGGGAVVRKARVA